MLRLSLDVCRHAHITSYIHIHLLAPFSRQGVHSGGSSSLHDNLNNNLLASASLHLPITTTPVLPPSGPSLPPSLNLARPTAVYTLLYSVRPKLWRRA